MKKWMATGIFLVVVIIAFGVFVFHITESTAPETPMLDSGNAAITEIQLTNKYSKGVHTVRVTASVPTACTALSATSSLVDSTSTPTIRVDLAAPVDEGMCLQLLTPHTFTLSVSAPANAPVMLYTNGAFATTTP